jgi:hypothetical protein
LTEKSVSVGIDCAAGPSPEGSFPLSSAMEITEAMPDIAGFQEALFGLSRDGHRRFGHLAAHL